MVKSRKPNRVQQQAPIARAGTPPTAQQAITMADRTDVIPLIHAVEKLRGTRLITYYLDDTASIAFDAMPTFYDQLRTIGRVESIDLWIHSHGGTIEVPWRLVQMIRACCKRFGVLVTEVAQSAATHIALGADEIVMGPFSLLSPVDPYRHHPLLPTGNNGDPLSISVQDLKHAVDFVKNEAPETGLTGEAYAQVIAALFDKVHPLALGAIEQSYGLSKLITTRMLSTHMDEERDAKKIEALADALCDGYKSHLFPIGLLEANRLGLKVVESTDELYDAMWALKHCYDSLDRSPYQMPSGAVVGASRDSVNLTHRQIGHVDSTESRWNCLALADAQGQNKGSTWLKVGTTPSGPR